LLDKVFEPSHRERLMLGFIDITEQADAAQRSFGVLFLFLAA
jgi:hypothetical protein